MNLCRHHLPIFWSKITTQVTLQETPITISICLNVKKRAIFLSTVIDNALFSSFQYIGKHHINSNRHY